MRQIHVVQSVESINEARFFRRMHIDRDCASDRTIRARAQMLMEENGSYPNVKGLWLAEEDCHLKVPEIDRCRWKILALCYAPEEVQTRIEACTASEEYLEAYLLDQLANEKLYQFSNQMNREIYETMKKEGCYLTKVFYPGEGEIALERQAEYLQMFGEDLPPGVTVHASGVLQPGKAMLYVMGADESETDHSIEHDCKNCANTRCSFRLE